MKLYSRFKKRPTVASEPGKQWEKKYTMAIDLTGHKYLEETGEVNIYDKIQESLEETKIENIIRRAVGGDPNALQVMHGTYMDITGMPKSLAEMQQIIIGATEEFYKLPLEIREHFNHSLEQYVAEYGTKGFEEKLKTKAMLETEKAGEALNATATKTTEEVKA